MPSTAGVVTPTVPLLRLARPRGPSPARPPFRRPTATYPITGQLVPIGAAKESPTIVTPVSAAATIGIASVRKKCHIASNERLR